jgi:hypothetical protein
MHIFHKRSEEEEEEEEEEYNLVLIKIRKFEELATVSPHDLFVPADTGSGSTRTMSTTK